MRGPSTIFRPGNRFLEGGVSISLATVQNATHAPIFARSRAKRMIPRPSPVTPCATQPEQVITADAKSPCCLLERATLIDERQRLLDSWRSLPCPPASYVVAVVITDMARRHERFAELATIDEALEVSHSA